MKPSEEIKQKYGFTTMKETAELANEPVLSLVRWHRLYPRRFELVMKGLVFERILKRYGVLNDANDQDESKT